MLSGNPFIPKREEESFDPGKYKHVDRLIKAIESLPSWQRVLLASQKTMDYRDEEHKLCSFPPIPMNIYEWGFGRTTGIEVMIPSKSLSYSHPYPDIDCIIREQLIGLLAGRAGLLQKPEWQKAAYEDIKSEQAQLMMAFTRILDHSPYPPQPSEMVLELANAAQILQGISDFPLDEQNKASIAKKLYENYKHHREYNREYFTALSTCDDSVVEKKISAFMDKISTRPHEMLQETFPHTYPMYEDFVVKMKKMAAAANPSAMMYSRMNQACHKGDIKTLNTYLESGMISGEVLKAFADAAAAQPENANNPAYRMMRDTWLLHQIARGEVKSDVPIDELLKTVNPKAVIDGMAIKEPALLKGTYVKKILGNRATEQAVQHGG